MRAMPRHAPPSSHNDLNGHAPRRSSANCDDCHAPARVDVLAGYRRGQPVRRRLCLPCSAQNAGLAQRVSRPAARPRLGLPALFVCAGALLAAVSLAGDWIGISGYRGFGHYQQLGVAIGALLVLLGAVQRVDVVALAGGLLFGIALLADVFHFAGTAGIGWKQQFGFGLSAALVALGLLLRTSSHYRDRSARD